MNEFKVDGRVQPDVKLFDGIAHFNISIRSGKFTMPGNTMRNRYTFIRIIYTGDIDSRIKQILTPGNDVRLYGMIDSEHYLAKSGKTVYNKILRVNKIDRVKFNRELDDYEIVE